MRQNLFRPICVDTCIGGSWVSRPEASKWFRALRRWRALTLVATTIRDFTGSYVVGMDVDTNQLGLDSDINQDLRRVF